MRRHYPLISYLDPDLTRRVRALQRQVSELTGSRASLDQWEPHISLGSEVWLDDSEVEAYIGELTAAALNHSSLSVKVGPLGFIDDWSGGQLPGNSSYGIYLDVTASAELQALVDALRAVTDPRDNYFRRPWPYRPHITIAFRDVTKTGYERAKAALTHTEFHDQASINSISLAMKQPDGKNVEQMRIPLRSG